MSPIRQLLPQYPCKSGGNLARANSTRAGLFLTPPAFLRGAPCSVLLIRDARSARGSGVPFGAANRADCMRVRRRHQHPFARRGLRRFSIHFREAAHQFRTHDTNRNQALASRGFGRGAAGRVQRFPPRLSIAFQVDDFAHVDGSKSFRPDNWKLNRSAFHEFGKIIHDRHR
jgi:hypothetical protein